MAAELIPTIYTLAPITQCNYFRCRLTDLGTDNVKKYFIYQLLDGDGSALTEEVSIRQSEFSIYVNEVAEENLYTKTPSPTALSWNSETGFIINIQLKFWEQVVDEDAGCSPVNNEVTIDGNIPIINSSLQFYDKPGVIGFYYFQKKSEVIELCKNGYDYLTIKTDSGGSAYLKYYNNGVLLSTVTQNYVAGVSTLRIPLDVTNATYVEIHIEGNLLYTIEIKDCGENVKMLFRDPLGGWSGLCFSQDKNGIKNSQTVAAMANICTNVTDAASYQKLGSTVIQKENHEYIEVSQEFEFTDREYLKRFLASENHLIEVNKYNGDKMFAKFILDAGEIVVYEDGKNLLKVSGYISAKFNANPTDVI